MRAKIEDFKPEEILFGSEYDVRVPIKLPEGALSFKLRVRMDEFPVIFVRYPDRVEKCHVAHRDGAYVPAWVHAVNKNGGAL